MLEVEQVILELAEMVEEQMEFMKHLVSQEQLILEEEVEEVLVIQHKQGVLVVQEL
jgi:hypothetical protein